MTNEQEHTLYLTRTNNLYKQNYFLLYLRRQTDRTYETGNKKLKIIIKIINILPLMTYIYMYNN